MKNNKINFLTGFIVFAIFFTQCNKEDDNKLQSVDFNGTLFIHPIDNSSGIQWGCYEYGERIGAASDTDGRNNTNMIINFHNNLDSYSQNPIICSEFNNGTIAALLCDTLTTYGYTDWYLPSKDELNAIYLKKDELGGFGNTTYWSSTEAVLYQDDFTWLQDFQTGQQYGLDKSSEARVRCVRRD